MPGHLHLILSTQGNEQLSSIVRDFKKFASKAIIEEIENINESRKEMVIEGI